MRQHADRVAANAEIGGMAEAHHAAIAEDQVEAHRGHRQDDNAREQCEQEAAAAQLDIDRQQQQGEQQRHDCKVANGEPAAHLPLAENRPSGFTTSTIAISR